MIEIDERRWPIVCFTFRGATSLEQLEEYLRGSDRILERGGKYAGIVLTEDVRPHDVKLIRRQAQWIKTNEARLREHSVGVALVIQSTMVRGMLRAVLWLQPMPQPYIVCGSVEEATAWVRERLIAAGVELPTAAAA